jgi:hypothetical protein
VNNEDSSVHWRERLAELIAEADPDLEARVEEADARSALEFVGITATLATEADRLLRDAVTVARQLGASWEAVGGQLNVTRQAAQQRFAVAPNSVSEKLSGFPARRESPAQGERRVITGVTSFNELQILDREGSAGWQLAGGGALYLEFVYVGEPIEHRRISSNRARATRRKAEEARWVYCFSWVFFHYFARLVNPRESHDHS